MADAEDDRTVRVHPVRPPLPSARRSLALPIAGLGVAGLAIATGAYFALDHHAPPAEASPPSAASAPAVSPPGLAAPALSPPGAQGLAQAAPPAPQPATPAAAQTAPVSASVSAPVPQGTLPPATEAPASPQPAAQSPAAAQSAQPPAQQLAMLQAPAPQAAEPPLPNPPILADEITIRDHRAPYLTVFRFLANPRVLVLDYPGLHQQARALNRIAALIEKADLPRDRVVTDQELAAYEQSTKQDDDGFYYGHDYRVSDMLRFFALADEQGIVLHGQERLLRRLIEATVPPEDRAHEAIISIPNPDARVDASMRATILHHELSHGEYFTNPVYADYVKRFWTHELTETERAGFRRFLAGEGYDAGDEDLMMNEMQAYLMHTPDPRFFEGAAAGLSAHRTAELQLAFYAGMPPGWLRDCTTVGRPRVARVGDK